MKTKCQQDTEEYNKLADSYPLNTFSPTTQSELIGFIQAEILKAREDERRRITKLLLLVDDFDKLIREIKEENKI